MLGWDICIILLGEYFIKNKETANKIANVDRVNKIIYYSTVAPFYHI